MSTSTTFYATGKRKSSIARVYMTPGKGIIKVNNRELDEYFGRKTLRMIVHEALELTENTGRYDISVNVNGGGLSGQAYAIRHGISRALQGDNNELRPVLKKAGLLTRDARKKERKKYGLAGARKAYQFSKR
ncbi:MAG: 30S ribosomal protein S9 [Candidatus Marinimicrobia bacterium]|jgi:small subunit ribosomal protein S9|nr:30S ribosomal protein S9 [Candidatus Neomarinimicrobiota bacterium]MBT3576643.1 30S ribosomal protein S9 [Candidatus Neomarinimicrobiota bacterium]MBT3630617.1 30S ribosomal protein S9 [Candidatus Neomarinimicrobiota bacterium]MBT4420221.1 30S ribosomal protein S9 [Candidatus Neomarinimicrobiota bacterium]MBT5233699.1 30S ribosomal protein S9 [Candidatus Neomarinimicrobiota bacterium]